MATVLERFNHLGLAHNNKILMIVGVHISNNFDFNTSWGNRIQKVQKEGDHEFIVWDYPIGFTKHMDTLIITFLEHYLDEAKKVKVSQ